MSTSARYSPAEIECHSFPNTLYLSSVLKAKRPISDFRSPCLGQGVGGTIRRWPNRLLDVKRDAPAVTGCIQQIVMRASPRHGKAFEVGIFLLQRRPLQPLSKAL
jgi:hypothetical protein